PEGTDDSSPDENALPLRQVQVGRQEHPRRRQPGGSDENPGGRDVVSEPVAIRSLKLELHQEPALQTREPAPLGHLSIGFSAPLFLRASGVCDGSRRVYGRRTNAIPLVSPESSVNPVGFFAASL